MIVAILLGRDGSTAFPKKNLYRVLGRPMVAYPLMAARGARTIDRTFVSTDSPGIAQVAKDLNCEVIMRPPELATKTALAESAYVHAFQTIESQSDQEIEMVVTLFANAPTVTSEIIDDGVRVLRENPDYDSAVSVSSYNMWSPLRARRIGDDGLLHPFVPFEAFGDPSTLSCDRDSQGDVWYADAGVVVTRPRCFTNVEKGVLPQRWMGTKIYPLKQWGGLDVDYEWQVPQIEFWLRQHGVEPAQDS